MEEVRGGLWRACTKAANCLSTNLITQFTRYYVITPISQSLREAKTCHPLKAGHLFVAPLGKSGLKLVVAVLAVLRVVHLINGWNPVNRFNLNDLRA